MYGGGDVLETSPSTISTNVPATMQSRVSNILNKSSSAPRLDSSSSQDTFQNGNSVLKYKGVKFGITIVAMLLLFQVVSRVMNFFDLYSATSNLYTIWVFILFFLWTVLPEDASYLKTNGKRPGMYNITLILLMVVVGFAVGISINLF